MLVKTAFSSYFYFMHIGNFLNYISKEKRYSIHTYEGYQKDLLSFEKFCVTEYGMTLPEVETKTVRVWFSVLLDQGLTPRTIRRKASSLKSFYKYLIRNEIVGASPMEGVPLPKLAKKLPEFVEEKSMGQLLTVVNFEMSYKGSLEKLVIELFYHTGIRLSELVNLKLSDVSLASGQLKVLGKRNKERIIPFSSQLSETISQFIAYRNSTSDYLFVTEKGSQVYSKMIYRIVNRYLEKVTTLTKKSPHVLRHTFATHMLNNGAELNAIKELLGHVNLSATEVYTHNSLEKIKSIYKQAHPRA